VCVHAYMCVCVSERERELGLFSNTLK